MSAESDVYAALSGSSGLTALVGTRIYPDVLPESATYPAVVFARSKTERILSISNVDYGSDVSIQVSAWAENRTSCDAAAVAIDAALVAAGIYPVGRQSGYDDDAGLHASVIEVQILEQP